MTRPTLFYLLLQCVITKTNGVVQYLDAAKVALVVKLLQVGTLMGVVAEYSKYIHGRSMRGGHGTGSYSRRARMDRRRFLNPQQNSFLFLCAKRNMKRTDRHLYMTLPECRLVEHVSISILFKIKKTLCS